MDKNSARENIKQNTRNLQGEIQGVDSEIAMLQDYIFNATAAGTSDPARRASTAICEQGPGTVPRNPLTNDN